MLNAKRVFVITPAEVNTRRLPLPADTSYLEHVFEHYDLTNIHELDSSIMVRLRYADTANFLHANFYDGLRKAYMTCDLAIRLCNAQYFLKRYDPSLSLKILDASRPLHIQQVMWDSLNLLPEEKKKYLSPPENISLHNYGCAVDVTIAGPDGNALDMGTGFDVFDSLSQPKFEELFRRQGRLSDIVLYNRRLLRHVMTAAGLRSISTEWWHFSLCTKPVAAARFPVIH